MSQRRGYFSIGVWHPKTHENIGTLLRSAACFGAAYVFLIGRRFRKQASDVHKAWRHMPVMEFGDVAALKACLPFACQLVGVELAEAATPLPQYNHPERACYLLGAEDHGLPPAVQAECHKLVVIPGASRCLNVATAGSIVLYDRVRRAA